MMLREVRYGINIGVGTVSVAPFGPKRFTYDIGNVFVQYHTEELILSVPGSGDKGYSLAGLKAGVVYKITSQGCINQPSYDSAFPSSATVNVAGVLAFLAPVGCRVIATAV